jgi:copper(I)-binding protein
MHRNRPTTPAVLLWVLGCATLLGASVGPSMGQARAQGRAPSYTVGSLLIETPWARATPAGATVGSAYAKITNRGTAPDRLIGGSLPGTAGVEVHEVRLANGVMKMRKLENGLEIAPGKSVELKPGGYHLMLIGLQQGLRMGQSIKGTLQFQNAGTVEVEFAIAPVGAASAGHSHH